MKNIVAMTVALGTIAAGAGELKNGSEFTMEDLPAEMTVHLKRGGAVRFLVEENGTNNYDAAPKDLSRWLEAIVWLDLHGSDIWTPNARF